MSEPIAFKTHPAIKQRLKLVQEIISLILTEMDEEKKKESTKDSSDSYENPAEDFDDIITF